VSPALLRTDGGARPTNPGRAGFAAVLELETGERYRCSRYIGVRTNNYAELVGLIVGMKMARLCTSELVAICDSDWVVNVVNGSWKCKAQDLKPLVREAQDLMGSFEGYVELKWEGRSNNQEADSLCTAAINYGRKVNPFTPKKVKEKWGEAFVLEEFPSRGDSPCVSPRQHK
jgi:ribonuclease HI